VVFHPRPKINRGTGRAYYPQKYIDFKRRAALELRLFWKQPTIITAIDIRLVFLFAKPKSKIRKRTATQRLIRWNSKGDLDNAVKSVLDVLQDAEVIKNDSQVWRINAEMWWAGVDEQPHTAIDIAGFSGGTWTV
tara:strand:- start:5406 stop:5810 length:405 start_codon:yes stop_codon:yes gene_type:complete